MEPIQIVWSEEFTVGHRGLDDEHRHFVELINAVYAAMASSCAHEEMGPLLDGMLNLAGQHFKRENSILIQINSRPMPLHVDRQEFIRAMIDAAIDKHIANHAITLPRLESIIRNIRYEVAAPQPHVSTDLKDWFLDHATMHDAHLRPVFRALNSSTT